MSSEIDNCRTAARVLDRCNSLTAELAALLAWLTAEECAEFGRRADAVPRDLYSKLMRFAVCGAAYETADIELLLPNPDCQAVIDLAFKAHMRSLEPLRKALSAARAERVEEATKETIALALRAQAAQKEGDE